MSNPLLNIQGLTTTFHTEEGVFTAVDDVNITLNRGETLGIVGESGSGKSVTSLSVMRLIPSPPGKISSGNIEFTESDGTVVDLLSLSEKEIRMYRGNEIAMIFQEPMTSLNPVLTCGFQVAEALRLHKGLTKKDARARSIELFSKVKLPRPESIYDSYPHQLSGGQKQRVMIAMAISCDPAILIADEPTTALDVTVQAAILDLMDQLQKEFNMGIIFITHDLGVVADIADRVVVMYKGKVVEEGPVQQIFRSPSHPYTKGLLACRPPLDKRLSVLPTVSDFMQVKDGEINETGLTISDVISKYEISKEHRQERLNILKRSDIALHVDGLSKYYPVKKGVFGRVRDHVKAVDDVSFSVHKGETLGLVGESGCGKTTLGRTILRLIEPTSGKITFRDRDLATLSASELRKMRKHIQIIFQDPYSSLNPRMTIGNAIMEPMKVHQLHKDDRERRSKVIELLERVSLNETHFSRYPHEFSGGQRQRICIARALALNPEFIICDESVSALDVSVQAQVLNLLNELRDQYGFTYIFISHDLSVVKFMSDRMMVMNAGRIEELGDADEIYNNPASDYTRKLISAIPKGM
jgi:peptide/nickel transport system ATP-binding protein